MPDWRRRFLIATSIAALSACAENDADRWEDLGALPALATTALNHTPMVESGGNILVGTSDGIWTRPATGPGEWTQAGLAGIGVFATRRHPTIDATLFAAGQPTGDPASAPFYRSDDGGATWVRAATFPRSPFDGSAEPFFDLAVAPDDPDRLYANLSGPSIAISTDGGQNWVLSNGETEVFFGDPCVIHVLESTPGTLFQGCEAPLDNAWVATQEIDPANPFTLANFTFVAGGPDYALENRRPNATASGPARPGTVYVGLEGALIALDPNGFDFVFRAGQEGDETPYVYVGAIWLDPEDPDHVVFGGGINGENTALWLFETRDHGDTRRQIRPPARLTDPSVEQIVPAGDDLAVHVSEAADPEGLTRSLRLYVLRGAGT
jgi:hypothetical protein